MPVATMMMSASSSSGRSMPFPTAPVILTDAPGLESHKKFEQTPFFAGSSAPVSGST